MVSEFSFLSMTVNTKQEIYLLFMIIMSQKVMTELSLVPGLSRQECKSRVEKSVGP